MTQSEEGEEFTREKDTPCPSSATAGDVPHTWMRGPAPPVGDCRIVEECEDFAVIAKPPHVLVHPTKPTGEPTLLSWLRDVRPGAAWSLIQRLDRETSGLLIAARTPEVASTFGKMLMARVIRKEYLVLTHGVASWQTAVFDGPIGRLGISESNPIWLRRGIVPENEGGQPSLTRCERLATSDPAMIGRQGHAMSHSGVPPGYSLIRGMPETGRPHQIRVHLAAAGLPLVGDKIYGPDPQLYLAHIDHGWTPEMHRALLLRRHALHAYRLRFAWKGVEHSPTAPLADDMALLAYRLGLHWADPACSATAPAAAE
ncbi:RluA family pseudouridine synthase [Verrucomicrobia bacterium LW23]|nr:RluA family pseudouridine synthase [Verrucomicrobia bacterium LW23]